MGILDNVERGLERAVNGAFARTFRSGVQPVEIASALKRELDIGAVIVDRDREGGTRVRDEVAAAGFLAFDCFSIEAV